MLKKISFMILFTVGITFTYAQVPLPPLPNVTLVMPPNPLGEAYKINITSAQLQEVLENRDQRKYVDYLKNSGYITDDEFNRRRETLDQKYEEFIEEIGTVDPIAMMAHSAPVNNELDKIWRGIPCWPHIQMHEWTGFNIHQPPGTRASYRITQGLLEAHLTPYTEQTVNNIKQQLEALLGIAFDKHPTSPTILQQNLHSSRSGDGKPYLIELHWYPGENRIAIAIWLLRSDI